MDGNSFQNHIKMSEQEQSKWERYKIIVRGMTSDEAQLKLKELEPTYYCEIVKPKQPVHKDLRDRRIRLHVNNNNIVLWISFG